MDALARILLAVAGVEGEPSMQVGMETPVGFGRADIAQRHILVVERPDALRQFCVFVLGVLVQPCHIDCAHVVVEQPDARIPVPRLGNGALQVGTETEHVALELVVGTGAVKIT